MDDSSKPTRAEDTVDVHAIEIIARTDGIYCVFESEGRRYRAPIDSDLANLVREHLASRHGGEYHVRVKPSEIEPHDE